MVTVDSKREFFRQYLEAAKSLVDIRPSAMDVLAELLFWNDKYQMLPKEDRDKIIFNYDTKVAIMDYLGMTKQSFDNILTYLRAKDILNGNSINKKYELSYENNNVLSFVFKIKEEKE